VQVDSERRSRVINHFRYLLELIVPLARQDCGSVAMMCQFHVS